MRPQARRVADAAPPPGRCACSSTVAAGPARRRGRTRSRGPELRSDRPGPSVGGRRDPVPHHRRLVPSRRSDRPVGHARVVGWAMDHRVTANLVTDALVMAFERRRPDRPVVHHSYVAWSTRHSGSRNGGRTSSSHSRSVPPATATTTPQSNRSSQHSNAVGRDPRHQDLRTPAMPYAPPSSTHRKCSDTQRIQQRLGQRSPIDYEQASVAYKPVSTKAGQLQRRAGSLSGCGMTTNGVPVAQFRPIGRQFPEVEEAELQNRPLFRVHSKRFALFNGNASRRRDRDGAGVRDARCTS